MKHHYLIILLITPFFLKAQERRKYFYGTLKSNSILIGNAHIINTKTGQGTFSNEQGNFKIFAKEKDSLTISYVGYETKTLLVEKFHFGIQKNTIKLNKSTITLEEVALKKHNLFGVLIRDMKQTPEDIAVVKSKGALDFSNIDFDKATIEIIDDHSRKNSPDSRKLTDPTALFAGAGTSFSGLDKYALERRKQRREINFKENFPKMLLSEFGEHFFFVDLRIPKENYYHFIEYCNALNIETLYKERKTMEVINILRNESKKYLQIIHKENE